MNTELSKAARMILKGREVKQQVAEKLGIKENRLYYWLSVNSPNLIRLDVLQAISEVSGIEIDQLTTKLEQTAAYM